MVYNLFSADFVCATKYTKKNISHVGVLRVAYKTFFAKIFLVPSFFSKLLDIPKKFFSSLLICCYVILGVILP